MCVCLCAGADELEHAGAGADQHPAARDVVAGGAGAGAGLARRAACAPLVTARCR